MRAAGKGNDKQTPAAMASMWKYRDFARVGVTAGTGKS